MTDLVIDVRGLTKAFGGKPVVDGLDLRVERGAIYGFLGPNGSGKTTSIRMLCGLLTPDAGSGTCLGLDVRRQSALIKAQVGYMTQKFSWWEDLTIQENLRFAGRMHGVPNLHKTVQATLARLGLSARRHQLAGALSGGWKQRLALAACLLHQPKLLLLDEPTAGVDPKARRDFWAEIHALAREGLTVLVSTHYMDEAERCHRLAYIANGKLLAEGTVAQILQRVGLTTYAIDGPSLMGVILTMTLIMQTGLAIARERERGTMENLLAMPVRPLEVMIGKLLPYILVAYIQVAVILSAAHFIFAVPILGSIPLLLGCVLVFVIANLSVGLLFSTLARNQMQAMQMTFFFFLPSILLSGFLSVLNLNLEIAPRAQSN